MQESGDFSACNITSFNISSILTVNVGIYISSKLYYIKTSDVTGWHCHGNNTIHVWL